MKPQIGLQIYETLCNDRFMRETNFDWDDLRLFLAVARRGGLAAAAASTGKSPPTLGRRMVELERRLGRDLFRRLARGYEVTEDGEALLRTVETLEGAILPLVADAEQSVLIVKVSAGTWVTYHLCRHVEQIIKTDPIRLRFISAEEVLDIGRREAVIGIRNQRPESVGLAGRKIGQVRFAVYSGADALAPLACVLGKTPSARWVQVNSDPGGRIEVTSPRNALDLALAGQVRAVLPTFIGDSFDTLNRTSPPIKELDHDQWLVTHHEDRYLPEVRMVIDRVYGILSGIGSRD